MLQQGSLLKIVDNTTVKEVTVIRALKSGKRPLGEVGDVVVASVKSLRKQKADILRSQRHLKGQRKRKDLGKGDIVQVLVIGALKYHDRAKGIGGKSRNQTGISVRSPFRNVGLLVTESTKDPFGTRIRGPVPGILRSKGFVKVISLAKSVNL